MPTHAPHIESARVFKSKEFKDRFSMFNSILKSDPSFNKDARLVLSLYKLTALFVKCKPIYETMAMFLFELPDHLKESEKIRFVMERASEYLLSIPGCKYA